MTGIIMNKRHAMFCAALVASSSFLLCGQNTSSAPENETGKLPVKAYFDGGKLHFSTRNDNFHLWFDNRIYLDAAVYSPTSDVSGLTSKANKDLEDDDTHFRFSNGVSVRRARFGIKATLYDRWFAELDLDFAYNEVEIKDMYLGYKFNDHFSVKAGNFKVPMSMERTTSSKYLMASERPMAVEAFADGRRLGVAGTGWGRHWWASAGVFGRKVDIIQKERNRGGDGYAFAGRVAVSPILTEDMTLHVGGYFNYQTPSGEGMEDKTVLFRTFPESRVDRRRFVQAEIENVNHYYTGGVELGFRYRKFLMYGEYIYNNVSRYAYDASNVKTDLKNAELDGWYVAASYMIWGENRQYSPDEAEFGPMKMRRKGGNLEVAARVSNVNMNDFHDAAAYITGGEATAYSASLNWYPVRNVLIGLNYTFMDNDKYADSKGQITKNGQALKVAMPSGIDFHIFQLRAMVSF